MSTNNDNFDVCIYHSPCTDGLVAAWAIRKLCPNVELMKCTAGANPTGMREKELEQFRSKNVIFVDICGTPEYISKLAEVAETVVVIDHHTSYYKKFEGEFPENVYYIFDEGKAACELVWEKLISRRRVPWFVQYVADRDLFQERMPHSRAISQALYDGYHIRSFDGLDGLYNTPKDDVDALKDELARKGASTLLVRNELVKSAAKCAKWCEYKTYNIWLYTCPKFVMSDVGARLMTWRFDNGELPDFVVGWLYDVEKHQFKLSFRSSSGSKVDVSEIAMAIARGGGGHRTAAACTIPSSTPLRSLFDVVEFERETSSISCDCGG
jgi:hypothetical protein